MANGVFHIIQYVQPVKAQMEIILINTCILASNFIYVFSF